MIDGIHERLGEAEEILNDGQMFANDRVTDLEKRSEGVLNGVAELDKIGEIFSGLGKWIVGAAANARTAQSHYQAGFHILHGLAQSTNNSDILNALAGAHYATEQDGVALEALVEIQESIKKFGGVITTAQQLAVDIAEQFSRAIGHTVEERRAIQGSLQGIKDYREHL